MILNIKIGEKKGKTRMKGVYRLGRLRWWCMTWIGRISTIFPTLPPRLNAFIWNISFMHIKYAEYFRVNTFMQNISYIIYSICKILTIFPTSMFLCAPYPYFGWNVCLQKYTTRHIAEVSNITFHFACCTIWQKTFCQL